MNKKLRIVFMGTPDFAVESLKALYAAGHHIVGVITTADKKAGRGKKIQMSAVKEFALENQLNILTPLNLKDSQFIEDLRALKADLQIVVAFRMLPEIVWNMPPLGTFNLHASLLPQYRGAAPINHAIMNGEKETGVTTFFLDKKIDTGRIIMQERCAIGENETAGELHDRLMRLGASVVLKTVEMIVDDKVIAVDQSEISKDIGLKIAPKLFKEDGLLDWNNDAEALNRKIRGLSPYPAAWTYIHIPDKNNVLTLKIYSSIVVSVKNADIKPGEVLSDGKTFFRVKAGHAALDVLELQLQGKKRMKIGDFLRGFNFSDGMRCSLFAKL